MFKIHSNIPVPVYAPSGRPAIEYPFADLSIKDVFFVPITDEDTEKTVLNRARTKAQRWKKQAGLTATKFRIAPAIDPDTANPCVGVWRVA